MSINVVLVGGAGDGRRIILPDNQMHYTLIKREQMTLSMTESTEPISYETQRYDLFRLHPVTRAVVFAYTELTPTQIMERLLEGYLAAGRPDEAPHD